MEANINDMHLKLKEIPSAALNKLQPERKREIMEEKNKKKEEEKAKNAKRLREENERRQKERALKK